MLYIIKEVFSFQSNSNLSHHSSGFHEFIDLFGILFCKLAWSRRALPGIMFADSGTKRIQAHSLNFSNVIYVIYVDAQNNVKNIWPFYMEVSISSA